MRDEVKIILSRLAAKDDAATVRCAVDMLGDWRDAVRQGVDGLEYDCSDVDDLVETLDQLADKLEQQAIKLP